MKTILFLIRIGSICFTGFWTIAGFFFMVIVTNTNSAYWDMPNEPIFFGINNTLFFLILAIPAWTAIYYLNVFYKKFDWNDDLIYLTLKTITKNTSSNISKTKEQLREGLESKIDDENNN